MKEIDTLIRNLGSDGFVGAWIGAAGPAVYQWRHRNKVPSWHIQRLSKLALEEGHDYATPEWFANVNLKTATKRKRRQPKE